MSTHRERRRLSSPARWLLATLGLAVLATTACQRLVEGMCGNYVLDEYPSPDRQMRLVVFQRDCGATTGFSTQASVVAAGDGLHRGTGNVFVATTNHGAAPAGKGGGPELRVRWLTSRHVILAVHPAAHVFKENRLQEGVEVAVERFREAQSHPAP